MRTDVTIIGGGIIGCWTALFLRKRNITVTVIERDVVGIHASGVNYGSVRLQGRNPVEYPIAIRAQGLWEQAEAMLGADLEFKTTGHFRMAYTPQDVEVLRQHVVESRDYGVELELIERGEIVRRWPWLSDRVIAGTFSARDANANPRLATPAICRAAEALGAQFMEGHEVTGCEKRGDTFVLRTHRGATIESGQLVNCAGAWSKKVAAWFGEDMPIFAAGPADFVTEPVPYFIQSTFQAVDGSLVFRQIPRGNVIVAGHPRGPVDAVKNRARIPPRKLVENMSRLVQIVPALAGIHLLRGWTGIEGYLPDLLPIIFASDTTRGLFHAFGFSGHGFQMSPAVGAVICELVADGKSTTPIEAFSPHRFNTSAKAASDLDLKLEFDDSVLARTSA